MPLEYKKRKVAQFDVVEVTGDEEGGAIICFHGFGADAFDLLPLSKLYNESPRPHWFFPQGPIEIPIMPGYTGRAWFPVDIELLKKGYESGKQETVKAFPKDLSSVRKATEQFILELGIPPSHIFLGGFSQGAILATDVALHSFETYGGLFLLSGTLLFDEEWKKLAPLHAGMPFFQSHGQSDSLIPIEGAEKLEKLLLSSGLKGKLQVFKGGHEIPNSLLPSLHHFFTHYLAPHKK